MNSLKASLEQIPEIKELLKQSQAPLIIALNNNLDDCHDLAKLINDAIVDDPPITIKDGGVIKEGYNSLVDEYKKYNINYIKSQIYKNNQRKFICKKNRRNNKRYARRKKNKK